MYIQKIAIMVKIIIIAFLVQYTSYTLPSLAIIPADCLEIIIKDTGYFDITDYIVSNSDAQILRILDCRKQNIYHLLTVNKNFCRLTLKCLGDQEDLAYCANLFRWINEIANRPFQGIDSFDLAKSLGFLRYIYANKWIMHMFQVVQKSNKAHCNKLDPYIVNHFFSEYKKYIDPNAYYLRTTSTHVVPLVKGCHYSSKKQKVYLAQSFFDNINFLPVSIIDFYLQSIDHNTIIEIGNATEFTLPCICSEEPQSEQSIKMLYIIWLLYKNVNKKESKIRFKELCEKHVPCMQLNDYLVEWVKVIDQVTEESIGNIKNKLQEYEAKTLFRRPSNDQLALRESYMSGEISFEQYIQQLLNQDKDKSYNRSLFDCVII